MVGIKYKLRYLPLFYEDLESKLHYISIKLENPQADVVIGDECTDKIMEVRRFLYRRQNRYQLI